MKATSFVNEHSVEYVLVNRLVAILAQEHPTLIPIFFWKTREGSKIATQGMLGQHVRLLTVFARRPKVLEPCAKTVLMKVNSTLFDAAATAATYGCPVLLGVPLTSNLLTFTIDVPCSWFRLRPDKFDKKADAEAVELSMDGTVVSDLVTSIEGPLDTREILRMARADATTLSWGESVEAMTSIRRSSTPYRHWLFGSTAYRPFFLLIPS